VQDSADVMSVVFLGFAILVFLLFIQYQISICRNRRKISSDDRIALMQSAAVIRQNATEHAINTCMNYIMFVWAVLFTKAFQGVHCIQRERLVLGQDLGMACLSRNSPLSYLNAGLFRRKTLAYFLGISDFVSSSHCATSGYSCD